MPRRARLRATGIPWHVIQRGNNRVACFANEEDHEFYLGLLAELAPETGCSVHAYVLMTNHVHLLSTPQEPDSISRLMKAVSERHARRFNERERRTGTLWEGRFRSCLVDSESYLFTCQRYIEMNPVRAGMVTHPRDYAWSSYRSNAEGEPSLLVRPHALYEGLGADASARRSAYRQAFADSVTDAELTQLRAAVNSGLAIGTQDFLRRLQLELRRNVEPGPMGRPPKNYPKRDSGDLFQPRGDE